MSRKILYVICLLVVAQLAACGPQPSITQKQGTTHATSTPGGMNISIAAHQSAVHVFVTPTVMTPTPIPGAARSAQATATPAVSMQAPAQNVSAQSMPTPTPTAVPAPNSPPATTSQTDQLTQQLFVLINQDRAAQSLPPYTLNATLATGALTHSLNMSTCGLSHACPNEPAPCQRVLNEGIQYTSCGENVGYTSPNPDAWGGVKNIELSMLNEPPPAGHRFNLLNTGYHNIGIGIYIDAKGLVWITEDFTN